MGPNVQDYQSSLLQRCHPACGHEGSSHLSPVLALQFFIAMQVNTLLTVRQPMVDFYLLTFSRFPLRKKKHKNQTHDFRTSSCVRGYLLDHPGDDGVYTADICFVEEN